jgi:hypothetical protein
VPRSLIVDPQICDLMSLILAGLPEKALAFVRDWSGTVANSGHPGRPEILPRRLPRRGGASVVRRDIAVNRMEDLNVKIHPEANNQ